MHMIRPAALFLWAAVATSPAVHAQAIEPRLYSNAPIGMNFLIAGSAFATGGYSIDPALPVTKPDLTTTYALLAYVRSLDVAGRSGKLDIAVPYAWLDGSATLYDEPVSRRVSGFADPSFRLSVNLYGAPALAAQEFANYRQDLIVGVSLQVTAPLGQHDETRLVNLGANRWSFKPGVGVSKALGRWTVEGAATATVYTDNDEFYGGQTRSQEPLYSLQLHTIYNFPRGAWASVDVNYLTGGSTELDGTDKHDLQRNWRVGGTLVFPLDPHNSLKLYLSSGVSARTGNNFDAVGLAWQHRWAGRP
jgi:hypothetical protein